MDSKYPREKCVAVITGVFSVGIAIVYLILISFLDSRGQMLPPPSEALGVVVIAVFDSFVEVQQLFEALFL